MHSDGAAPAFGPVADVQRHLCDLAWICHKTGPTAFRDDESFVTKYREGVAHRVSTQPVRVGEGRLAGEILAGCVVAVGDCAPE